LSKRKKHPNKHIEDALRFIESEGWTVELTKGGSAHPWANAKCPYNRRSCRNGMFCRFGVWGTPGNPELFAKQIRSVVEKCVVHKQEKAKQAQKGQ